MNNINQFLFSTAATISIAVIMNGCATPPKASTAGESQPAAASARTGTNEFLKGMEVVEKPELEPELLPLRFD